MDARLQTLKPGRDMVRFGACIYRFMELRGEMVGYLAAHDRIAWAHAREVIWPDPTKAKPGVVYQRAWPSNSPLGMTAYEYAVGRFDGKLFYSQSTTSFDFTPDWQEVPEP